RHRNSEPDRLGRIVETLEMLAEAKDLAAVNPDALEHAIPIEEAVIVYRHEGRIPIAPLAIEPDRRHASSGRGGLLGRFQSRSHCENVLRRRAVGYGPRPSSAPRTRRASSSAVNGFSSSGCPRASAVRRIDSEFV